MGRPLGRWRIFDFPVTNVSNHKPPTYLGLYMFIPPIDIIMVIVLLLTNVDYC